MLEVSRRRRVLQRRCLRRTSGAEQRPTSTEPVQAITEPAPRIGTRTLREGSRCPLQRRVISTEEAGEAATRNRNPCPMVIGVELCTRRPLLTRAASFLAPKSRKQGRGHGWVLQLILPLGRHHRLPTTRTERRHRRRRAPEAEHRHRDVPLGSGRACPRQRAAPLAAEPKHWTAA